VTGIKLQSPPLIAVVQVPIATCRKSLETAPMTEIASALTPR
jgi:hypothetical protein